MSELDARKQTILRAIVIEYVSTAEPVGSEALVTKYPLGVKSATVRNEMAEMLDLGYLDQPHTSAGRIPSDLGYRYYVDRLVITRELEESTQTHLKDAAGDGEALQSVLRDTARAMSQLSHLLGVATTVRDMDVSVRTAVLSALGPAQALFVVALSNGHIENRMIECPQGLTLEGLGMANELLSTALVGKSIRQLARSKAPSNTSLPTVDALLTSVWNHLRPMMQQLTRGKIVMEGEEFLFSQPEFRRDVAGFTDLLRELSNSDTLYEAVAPSETAQTVTIGRENRQAPLRQMSVVRQSFYIGENEAGVIALVGPTRMHYEKGMPLVNYTARALSESLSRYFG